MKKYMFIIVAAMLVLFGGQANAQRCLPGMRGIELRGGFTDGFGKPVDFYTGIACRPIPSTRTVGWSVRNIFRRVTDTGICRFPVPSSRWMVAIS